MSEISLGHVDSMDTKNVSTPYRGFLMLKAPPMHCHNQAR
jgi:hypothetical protein